MVGDGPERGPAESLARELGLEQHVTFLGKQDHIERLIPLADVFLLPSQLESFGLAALEAMACGVPAVSTRVGGVPELITHEVDGFLEAPGDVAAQAARVTALVTDESLHRRMSEAARATAVTKFCSSRVIPIYERYYREICDSRT
jgi:glycosyltransferase involved in cell wall biosynthesis